MQNIYKLIQYFGANFNIYLCFCYEEVFGFKVLSFIQD